MTTTELPASATLAEEWHMNREPSVRSTDRFWGLHRDLVGDPCTDRGAVAEEAQRSDLVVRTGLCRDLHTGLACTLVGEAFKGHELNSYNSITCTRVNLICKTRDHPPVWIRPLWGRRWATVRIIVRVTSRSNRWWRCTIIVQ